MLRFRPHTALAWVLTVLLMSAAGAGVCAESPAYGGVLTFVVPAEPPSFDGHRETTFALIHPIAPFYSTLIRVNPDNPGATDDFVGDLALEVPEPTHDGTTYTFRLREDARFADGQPLSAHDVAASFNKIIFPPDGVASARQAFFSMVDGLYAGDAYTVVFELRYPSAAFLPALASPFNFIYSAAKLEQDLHWYEHNVLGSGPFVFDEHQPGSFIAGRRNPALPPCRPTLSRRLPGHFCQEAVVARTGHSRRAGHDRVSRLPPEKPPGPGARSGRGNHRAGIGLELRPAGDAEPPGAAL